MKRLTLWAALLAAVSLFAQEGGKLLTLEEAILGTQNSLRVAGKSGLGWMGDSDLYTLADSVDGKAALLWFKPDADEPEGHLLLETLQTAMKQAKLPPARRLPRVNWTGDRSFRIWSGRTLCAYDLDSGEIQKLATLPEGARDRAPHERGAVAYTLDNELWIALENGQQIQATQEGCDGLSHGARGAHRNEFGVGAGIFWSPDGKHVAFYRRDERMVTTYPLVDIDSRPAQLRNIRYPMTGQTSEQVSVGVYDIETGSVTYLQTGQPLDQYLPCVTWTPDSRRLVIAHLNRDQNHLAMRLYDAETGLAQSTLFEERDEQWVEPVGSPVFAPGSDRFVWLSMRDGFRNAYLYDLSGKAPRQLTSLRQDITRLSGFSTDGKILFFHAASKDGLESHAYRVGLRGGKPVQLTTEAGSHWGAFSGTGAYVIDRFSSLTTPSKIQILNAKGEVVRTLLDAPNNLEGYAIGEVKLLSIPAEDGTPLMARMVMPPDFDASKKYPVVVYVYGGPHGAMVSNSWMGSWQLWYHYMAQQGYIVFSLDNRGTNNRGAEFEQVIHRRLGTVEVADQQAGIDYLRSLDYVDADRIGVHGWSYGGFMTLSMLTRMPGVFKVGVAGGPVTDWAYYEVMYGERYMDTPQSNPEGYQASSPLTYVDQLDAPCLIIHGCVDGTVVWQNSLAYLRKAIDLGKQVDYFVYPGDEHNMRGRDRLHLYTKITEYLKAHL